MTAKRISLKLPQPLTDVVAASVSPFAALSKFVDPSGKLNFAGKAAVHRNGVDFSNGTSYKISMDELELVRILGRGQYGVVQLVTHKPTNVRMAMKEIRLELDETKMNHIVMELQVLNSSHNPHIIDFYGAFFIESCVYMCMEYMDGGSLDRLNAGGIPEPILSKIALSVIKGLHFLKTELLVIHRDVKPTNILINTAGQIKLCDFGVSGQLVQSLAKTNIGCQSYMAPERIATRNAGVYTARSDVWSVGISIVELGTGFYPFPGDAYDSVFAQLNAIVSAEPPRLPDDKFSDEARDFVAKCLVKDPNARPTYPDLLATPWLVKAETAQVDVGAWVTEALVRQRK
ncbi:MAP kinase kinase Wis1 [Polyrhizophydium stewartii]|uniref:mitogen-activated protein kinase kinase n=1 Tax=Polyrhizophydium stewartii TaxID=2732419 RepID=A0ABR4N4I0_9FUNG